MKFSVTKLLVLGLTVGLAACQDTSSPTDQVAPPSFAAAKKTPLTGTPAERAAQIAAKVNQRLAKAGSKYRLSGASFFTVGRGVPAFRQLKFGGWADRDLTYMFDVSDYPAGANTAAFSASLTAAYETWDAVPNANINLTRVADTEANPDVLDAIVTDKDGNCVDIVDVTSPVVLDYNPTTGQIDLDPVADNVVGGWLKPDYFEKCLGSADIIAVTWTFTGGDANHDNLVDIAYNEQYFNTEWQYVTSGSVYLDFDGPFDLQSIAVHEDGHALGLGHTGGPNDNQPFKLHPNGRVFDPEAVMNPFNLGGEKRTLFPLDKAALRSIYARPN
jgi:Matrixin